MNRLLLFAATHNSWYQTMHFWQHTEVHFIDLAASEFKKQNSLLILAGHVFVTFALFCSCTDVIILTTSFWFHHLLENDIFYFDYFPDFDS